MRLWFLDTREKNFRIWWGKCVSVTSSKKKRWDLASAKEKKAVYKYLFWHFVFISIVKTGFHMERGRGGNEKELKKTVQIAIYHVIGGERRRMQQAHKTFKYKKTPGISLIIWEKEAFMNAKLSQSMSVHVPRKWLRICCRGGHGVAFSHTHRIPFPSFLFTGETTLTYKKDPHTHIQCFPTYAWGGQDGGGGGRHFPHKKKEKWKGIDPTNGGDFLSPPFHSRWWYKGDRKKKISDRDFPPFSPFFANATTNGFFCRTLLRTIRTYSRT